ncbi:hypothetical protein GUI12_01795 [Anaplasmataceae bacterium AB001_6]|nr:hypothetical protein GUI12_01795 [Anaplasmataceae bacterium AB001_6]
MYYLASLIEIPMFKIDLGHDNHISNNIDDASQRSCPPCVCHCPILDQDNKSRD